MHDNSDCFLQFFIFYSDVSCLGFVVESGLISLFSLLKFLNFTPSSADACVLRRLYENENKSRAREPSV